ncbi:dihydrofolate reductase [Nocardioides acrostichi]|uniref:Dihydrofolate reductase n=1 Tax=Nocardioides acrostichi TaxID=2784339 RepID=A0A930YDA9_9ACTN|nr:dihydrofolate reductase [Nocardioides acrostichi]MBF4162294.1 dihydrofolate reductase [Nocardioides acrostichi]
MSAKVILVAAVARNGVIGNGPDIPWQVPGEQKAFKHLTMGHTLLMGRTTYESIGRPLPGRETLVLTRDPHWRADGVHAVRSVEEAVERKVTLPGHLVVAGGAQVYEAALPLATEQVISQIPLEPVGDVFYPAFDRHSWTEVRRDEMEGYERVWLRRA